MNQQFEKKELKKKSENLSDWYTQVILKAELADYAPVKGTMVIRPYGYALWEAIQDIFNRMMKTKGVENAYFPLFIPHSLLDKEKKHVEGFSPQLALVTIGGGEKLKDPLVVRPTSETIMYAMYAKWVHSWRDLPILINQWNNVVRWEKRTYLFLRTTEFLWQEGHTAHETEKEAIDLALSAFEWYRQVFEDYLAIPVYQGIKSETEKFAGAKTTYTNEALMPDGKALQNATSHNLGQNFSKVFGIQFASRDGKMEYVWQTSWGFSTRVLGALFLMHGDDNCTDTDNYYANP
jgi:prolyl-tRNA synthetase